MRSLSQFAFVAVCSLSVSACSDLIYYDADLNAVGRLKDLSAVSSTELCDAASYFTYDAPGDNKATAKKLLSEVLSRGNISRSEYNSALTGDVELGMRELAVVCAWGLPTEEVEYYISGGRKYTRWKYEWGEYGLDRGYLEFINDKVVSIDTGA